MKSKRYIIYKDLSLELENTGLKGKPHISKNTHKCNLNNVIKIGMHIIKTPIMSHQCHYLCNLEAGKICFHQMHQAHQRVVCIECLWRYLCMMPLNATILQQYSALTDLIRCLMGNVIRDRVELQTFKGAILDSVQCKGCNPADCMMPIIQVLFFQTKHLGPNRPFNITEMNRVRLCLYGDYRLYGD